MIPEYHNSFRNNIDIMEHNEGTFGVEKVVVDISLTSQPPPPPIEMVDTSYGGIIQAQVNDR